MHWGCPAHHPPRRPHPAPRLSPVGSPDFAQDLGLQRHRSRHGTDRHGSERNGSVCPALLPYQPLANAMGSDSAPRARTAPQHRPGRLRKSLWWEEEKGKEEEQAEEVINFISPETRLIGFQGLSARLAGRAAGRGVTTGKGGSAGMQGEQSDPGVFWGAQVPPLARWGPRYSPATRSSGQRNRVQGYLPCVSLFFTQKCPLGG